tara:strand:- start:358 stop:528 length:171 start_codon:yes stop_codon:yes gene_type:complete
MFFLKLEENLPVAGSVRLSPPISLREGPQKAPYNRTHNFYPKDLAELKNSEEDHSK